MRFAILSALAFLAASPSYAASVCIVSAAEDQVVCDGKVTQRIDDNTEAFSLAIKQTLEKGYKLVSQGGGDKSNFQIWTLIKE